jgi:hypothetical protein
VAPVGGDIPDNVVYHTYTAATFSIQYPEGWVQSAHGDGVTLTDKDNKITVTITSGAPPTTDSAGREARAIPGASITKQPHALQLTAGSTVALTYNVDGDPNPVTGKKPHLTVDRYELGRSGRVAVLDLATPVGTDNVDAYLSIAKSFGWR